MSSNNGGRSPKDLRHLLSVARQDTAFFPEDIEENLAKLKSLPKDKVSENAMLRDRIDQQSELICILKKQADSSLIKSQTLEKDMRELQATKEEAECNYHDQVRKYAVLEKRFEILFYNHEEIIKIKDGYKAVNDELRKENRELSARRDEEVAALVGEKNVRIKELEEDVKIVTDKFHNSDGQLRDLKDKSITREKHFYDEVKSVTSNAETSEQRALEAEKKATLLYSQLSEAGKELVKLREENTRMTQESSEQTQTINKQKQKVNELLGKVHELEILMKRERERFTKEMEDASANVQVRKLKSLLKKVEEKDLNHDKEFEAYKLHTEKLLSKERELNSKLRQLIG